MRTPKQIQLMIEESEKKNYKPINERWDFPIGYVKKEGKG